MAILERIIAHGNYSGPNWITCADGFKVSVIAGPSAYCTPRPKLTADLTVDYRGPFTALELGFPSARPEPWDDWSQYADGVDDPTKDVYGYVPVDMVRALIEAHGGER